MLRAHVRSQVNTNPQVARTNRDAGHPGSLDSHLGTDQDFLFFNELGTH